MTATAAEVLREPPLAEEPDVKPISDREFALFRDLIGKEAGIDLPPFKKALVMGRLSRRLRELKVRSFADYYERVVGDKSGGELFEVINRICTNETSFFREPQQFEFLEKRIYPSWLSGAGRAGREKKIRAWSAACSTGEEPFSLGMSLLGNFPPDSGWRIEILATDLSTRVLSKARQATWPVEGARRIPENYLKPFMLRGVRSQMGSMKAAPELRSLVKFHRHNLISGAPPAGGPFDLIFCRNVLIYFSRETKMKVVRSLLSALAPDGYLFVGHAESLGTLFPHLQALAPSIYGKEFPGGAA